MRAGAKLAGFPSDSVLAYASRRLSFPTHTNQTQQHLVVRSIGSVSRAFMAGAVTTRVDGRDALTAALARPAGVPLITVSNHETALDDPLVVSALLPDGGVLTNPEGLRWTLCATDRCFTSTLAAAFFRAGKVLPVARGAGLAQPGMAAAEGRLAAGEWVHVFPEGTRSRDGALRPARKGVGRLAVAAARGHGAGPHSAALCALGHAGRAAAGRRGAARRRRGGRGGRFSNPGFLHRGRPRGRGVPRRR